MAGAVASASRLYGRPTAFGGSGGGRPESVWWSCSGTEGGRSAIR